MNLTEFFTELLHVISAPVSGPNMLALTAWHACEGGNAAFNPLNTTLWQPGCTNYNSFGPGGAYHVRNYTDERQGVHATALTLENGHYDHILAALRSGRNAMDVASGLASREMDVWGTGGGHVRAWLLAHHGGTPTPPRPGSHPTHGTYVVRPGDSLSGIAARYHVHGGWEALYAANKHTIGANPNHIEPGERLTLP